MDTLPVSLSCLCSENQWTGLNVCIVSCRSGCSSAALLLRSVWKSEVTCESTAFVTLDNDRENMKRCQNWDEPLSVTQLCLCVLSYHSHTFLWQHIWLCLVFSEEMTFPLNLYESSYCLHGESCERGRNKQTLGEIATHWYTDSPPHVWNTEAGC